MGMPLIRVCFVPKGGTHQRTRLSRRYSRDMAQFETEQVHPGCRIEFMQQVGRDGLTQGEREQLESWFDQGRGDELGHTKADAAAKSKQYRATAAA